MKKRRTLRENRRLRSILRRTNLINDNCTFDGEKNIIVKPNFRGANTLYVYFNKQDQIHREDGPAICNHDDVHDEGSWYWKNEYFVTFEDWLAAAKISEEQETYLMLKFF